MEEDSKLLAAYARDGSEQAFRDLFARHSGMVHGVARRIAGEADADEVTQAAFLLLARKAASLQSKTNLAGWLYKTARFVALESVRRHNRARELQRNFSQMDTEPEDSTWTQLAPVLDTALHHLRNADREAIILRFLQGRSFAEVAAATNSTEAAAKMRVARALEKLRANLVTKGVTISTAALAASLTANAAPAASPVIAATVLSQSAAPAIPSLAKLTLKMLLMKKFKMAAAVAIALALTTAISVPLLRPTPIATTFYPMDGEWTGHMILEANGAKTRSPVFMMVKTTPNGKRAEIEMRVGDPTVNIQTYHFAHEIDETGRNIATVDDPRVNVLNGYAKVTRAYNASDDWRATILAERPYGVTECDWRVRGNQLTIARRDRMGSRFSPRGESKSTLELHRKS